MARKLPLCRVSESHKKTVFTGSCEASASDAQPRAASFDAARARYHSIVGYTFNDWAHLRPLGTPSSGEPSGMKLLRQHRNGTLILKPCERQPIPSAYAGLFENMLQVNLDCAGLN